MYARGNNIYNQLNIDDYAQKSSSYIKTPALSLINPTNLNSFSTYGNHSVWVTEDGVAYGIGDNTQGCIDPCRKMKIFTKPIQINFLQTMFKNETFKSAVCGESYTLYLTSGFDPSTKLECSIAHFVDANFKEYPNSFYFEKDVYAFGGSSYAAIITESNLLHIIKPGCPAHKTIPFENHQICDVALCETFTIVITNVNAIISIPAGESQFNNTKYRKLASKLKIHTISGTSNIAVAIASDEDSNYSLVIFQYKLTNKHPTNVVINLSYYYEKNIRFKYVSCGESYFLLLSHDGCVYLADGTIENLANVEKYKKLSIPSYVNFIIAGKDLQIFITSNVSNYMVNYHISEDFNKDEEEEEEEEAEYDIIEREDDRINKLLESQKYLTLNEINQLNKLKFTFISEKIDDLFISDSSIDSGNRLTKLLKVHSNIKNTNLEESESESITFWTMKIFKFINVNNFITFIDKNKCLCDSDLYHPFIVRVIASNYDFKGLQDERRQALDSYKSNNNKNKKETGNEEEAEAEAEIEDLHNLDLTISINKKRLKSNFFNPLIISPYFPQNLYDAILSKKYNVTDRIFWITEILTTISHLHKKGIYHERLTPWNILISNSNDAFISDVFISGLVETDQTILFKDEKALWFIDPEIINNDILSYESNDFLKKNHDIYSIGKLIFFILAGSIDDISNNQSFIERLNLQYLINDTENNENTPNDSFEKIEFPPNFTKSAKELIYSCITFSKEGRPSAASILDYLKSIKFQLVPKVNDKYIDLRLKMIDEIIQNSNIL